MNVGAWLSHAAEQVGAMATPQFLALWRNLHIMALVVLIGVAYIALNPRNRKP